MYRKTYRFGCFIKYGKIKGYFAYRLPGETDPKFFTGDFVKSLFSEMPQKDEIIIHSFTGDEIYIIKNLTEIKPDKVELSYSKFTNQTFWDENEYLKAFEKTRIELNSGRFRKLVLSRIKKVATKKNGAEIFLALNQKYKNTFNYIFSSVETGTWIGASPELLLKYEEDQVSTVSLAGTKPSDGFSEWTSKEREEQKMVTDFILEAFSKNKIAEITSSDVYTSKAGPVEHLKTDISGVTENESQVYALLNQLHPTPATCGIPKLDAIQKIMEIESHQRQFYTGYIGICNENTRLFFVNLRCMEIREQHALLFVGGGITTSSVGAREWLETEKKAETLIQVL